MKSSEFNLRPRDGLDLLARRWEPAGDPTGVLCVIHGLGEHGGRYDNLGDYMTSRGWTVIAIDLRGHGRSGGRRGHISSYDAMLDDISILITEAAGRYPGRPVFLFGQSMGGNLVINHALRRKSGIAGVIASSPMLRTAFEPPRWKRLLGKYLRSILPLLPLRNEIRAADLSRDPRVVHAYESDPLVHDRLTLRFYDVILAGEWAIRHASNMEVPALIMHGDSDRVTSSEASREFSVRAGDICTYMVWEGFYHEIHNEPGKERALDHLTEWLNRSASKR